MRNAKLWNDLETIFWSLLFLSTLMFQIKTNEKWCFVIVSMDAIRKIADYSFWLKPVTFLVSHSTGFSPGCHTIMAFTQHCSIHTIPWLLFRSTFPYPSCEDYHFWRRYTKNDWGHVFTCYLVETGLSVIRFWPLTGTALILEAGVHFVIN